MYVLLQRTAGEAEGIRDRSIPVGSPLQMNVFLAFVLVDWLRLCQQDKDLLK